MQGNLLEFLTQLVGQAVRALLSKPPKRWPALGRRWRRASARRSTPPALPLPPCPLVPARRRWRWRLPTAWQRAAADPHNEAGCSPCYDSMVSCSGCAKAAARLYAGPFWTLYTMAAPPACFKEHAGRRAVRQPRPPITLTFALAHTLTARQPRPPITLTFALAHTLTACQPRPHITLTFALTHTLTARQPRPHITLTFALFHTLTVRQPRPPITLRHAPSALPSPLPTPGPSNLARVGAASARSHMMLLARPRLALQPAALRIVFRLPPSLDSIVSDVSIAQATHTTVSESQPGICQDSTLVRSRVVSGWRGQQGRQGINGVWGRPLKGKPPLCNGRKKTRARQGGRGRLTCARRRVVPPPPGAALRWLGWLRTGRRIAARGLNFFCK